MTKRTEEETATMAKAWEAVNQIADHGEVWRVEAARLREMEAIFRRRCRRLDTWRKENSAVLTGAAKSCQRHGRAAVNSAFLSLGMMGTIDPKELPAPYLRQCRDAAMNAAAMLITEREMIDAGGITRRYVERRQAASN